MITGHSLGGCLATVVAVWLADDFARNGVDTPIRLVTFAAPTRRQRGLRGSGDPALPRQPAVLQHSGRRPERLVGPHGGQDHLPAPRPPHADRGGPDH
ncbi:lipase family protein [Caulobacter segnis]